jgi:hypothetical protein
MFSPSPGDAQGKGRCEKINPWPKLEGWSGEEVLERYLLNISEASQAIITVRPFYEVCIRITQCAHSKTS